MGSIGLENLRSLGESHPEDEDKLEGVVEGYSVSKESNRSEEGHLRNQYTALTALSKTVKNA
jgi:hypothetical protein